MINFRKCPFIFLYNINFTPTKNYKSIIDYNKKYKDTITNINYNLSILLKLNPIIIIFNKIFHYDVTTSFIINLKNSDYTKNPIIFDPYHNYEQRSIIKNTFDFLLTRNLELFIYYLLSSFYMFTININFFHINKNKANNTIIFKLKHIIINHLANNSNLQDYNKNIKSFNKLNVILLNNQNLKQILDYDKH